MIYQSLDVLLKNSENNEYHGAIANWRDLNDEEDGDDIDTGVVYVKVGDTIYRGLANIADAQSKEVLDHVLSDEREGIEVHIYDPSNEDGFLNISAAFKEGTEVK
jgi:hypothetical protein